MKTIISFIILASFVLTTSAYGQIEVKATKTALTRQQTEEIDKSIKNYSIFSLSDVAKVFPSEGEIKVLLKLDNDFQCELDLKDNNSLIADDIEYGTLNKSLKSGIKLFKSKDPNNTTRLAIYNGIIDGVIDYEGERFLITPLSFFIQDNSNRLIFCREKDIQTKGYISEPIIEELNEVVKTRSTTDFTNTSRVIRVAVHADHDYYSRYGAGTYDRMAGLINQCEALYENTFNITFLVTYNKAFTNKVDDKYIYILHHLQLIHLMTI